jgi:hypothetical protein
VIAKSKLKVGAYYYFVTYEDSDLTVPVIETLQFKKEVLVNGTEEKLFLFDRLGEAEPKQSRLTEDLLHTVFEFDDLVTELEANRQAQREGRVYEPSRPEEL